MTNRLHNKFGRNSGAENSVEDLLSSVLVELETLLLINDIEEIKSTARRIIQDIYNIKKVRNISEHLVNYDDRKRNKAQKFDNRISLNGVLKKSLEIMSETIQREGIKVSTSFDKELRLVSGDFHDLLQLVLNLLANAFDAVSVSHSSEIFIESFSKPGFCGFAIEDSGKGISIDAREKIFTPYVTEKSFGEGTGLGLSVCKEIVDAHSGKINAVSPLHLSGARFEVLIPIEEANLTVTESNSRFGKMNVLILEDSLEISRALKKFIEGKGNKAEAAFNALDAITMLREYTFDLIISDYLMPDITGLAFLESARQMLGPNFPAAIIMSGKEKEEIESFGYVYLRKPFMADELWAAVNEAICRKKN